MTQNRCRKNLLSASASRPADGPMALMPGEVHVWTIPLDSPPRRLPDIQRLLDEEERARAARLRSPEEAARFIVSHGRLRSILSRYTGISPEKLRFHSGKHGKPMLLSGKPAFNLSHSAGLALVAVACAPVGIDLEFVDEGISFQAMAERYFSTWEASTLRSLPPDRQLAAFYSCWTRKEAYLKGCGAGFSLPSNCFDVSLTPEEPAAVLRHEFQPDEIKRWHLFDLPVPPGFQGALAIEGEIQEIRFFT